MVIAKAAWLQPIIHKDTCMSSYIKAFIMLLNTPVFTAMNDWCVNRLRKGHAAVQLNSSNPAAPGVVASPVFFASELLEVVRLLPP